VVFHGKTEGLIPENVAKIIKRQQRDLRMMGSALTDKIKETTTNKKP
jgi:CO dehydrogenase/acetyl-CoA synthase epsilon subunit